MKMRRLIMCQSVVDATTTCMVTDYNRSVMMRSRRPTDQTLVEHTTRNPKYIRLGERRRVQPSSRRPSSITTNALKVDQNALPLSAANNVNNVFQVVVMKVSIHCQGCAGKVKKHLSKMEGVTSFSIDLETKRVTVMGHLSPVAVLESMSKVKKAELWPR